MGNRAMKMKKVVVALLLSLVALASAAADKVIGYFPYWVQYSQFYPKDIRYQFLTHIHYASLSPASDGSLALADGNDEENYKELSRLSKENGVKLIVSIGGMEMEGTLAEIAATEELRSKFASNLIAWMRSNGASGAEIDWQNLDADNAENFGNLLNSLLSAFNGEFQLAVSVYPAGSLDVYDASVLNKLDYITVFMADQMTEEQSSLKANQGASFISSTLSALTGKGIEKSKIAPIVFLYGKTFAGAKGLGSSHSGVGSGNDGFVPYKELMVKFDSPDYKVSFDEASKSEVAVSEMEAITFMGIPSVKAVAEEVKSQGFAGVAVYDLSQDHHESIVSLLVTIGLELRPGVDYSGKKK